MLQVALFLVGKRKFNLWLAKIVFLNFDSGKERKEKKKERKEKRSGKIMISWDSCKGKDEGLGAESLILRDAR